MLSQASPHHSSTVSAPSQPSGFPRSRSATPSGYFLAHIEYILTGSCSDHSCRMYGVNLWICLIIFQTFLWYASSFSMRPSTIFLHYRIWICSKYWDSCCCSRTKRYTYWGLFFLCEPKNYYLQVNTWCLTTRFPYNAFVDSKSWHYESNLLDYKHYESKPNFKARTEFLKNWVDLARNVEYLTSWILSWRPKWHFGSSFVDIECNLFLFYLECAGRYFFTRRKCGYNQFFIVTYWLEWVEF
jgi:hypothetical protein